MAATRAGLLTAEATRAGLAWRHVPAPRRAATRKIVIPPDSVPGAYCPRPPPVPGLDEGTHRGEHLPMATNLIAAFLVALAALGGGGQSGPTRAAGTTPHASLAALDWLAGGRWVASSSDPKAPNLMRETFFEWAPNGQALRFRSYATDRQLQRRPYVEGWYVFHPGRRQVIFTYVDGGGYYAGHVRVDGDVVDHEFEGVATTGAVQQFRYSFTRSGPDEMVTRIFDRHEQQWRRVVELVYRRQPF